MGHAIVIAQVDEQDATVVTYPMDPARKTNGVTDIGFVQVGAGMAAIGVHNFPF